MHNGNHQKLRSLVRCVRSRSLSVRASPWSQQDLQEKLSTDQLRSHDSCQSPFQKVKIFVSKTTFHPYLREKPRPFDNLKPWPLKSPTRTGNLFQFADLETGTYRPSHCLENEPKDQVFFLGHGKNRDGKNVPKSVTRTVLMCRKH